MQGWLILGHGSVGSALARRIADGAETPFILDPAPRVPIEVGQTLDDTGSARVTFRWAVSCVTPARAPEALETARAYLGPESVYCDWNTLPPQAKCQLADAAPCPVADIALLDSLDASSLNSALAISGEGAAAAAEAFRGLGFHVDVVGEQCGEAAALKLARSAFMKTLEALLVEFESLLASLAGRQIVAASIERNLGPQFASFARLLVETDRLHAERRAAELEAAVANLAEAGHSVRLATTAVEILKVAASAWRQPDAPAPGSDAHSLGRFLGSQLARSGTDEIRSAPS